MHHNSSPYDACAIFMKSFDALCEKQTEMKPCFCLFMDYQRIKLRSASQRKHHTTQYKET